MTQLTRKIVKPFASLRLTVVLIAMLIVLVFAATWAQIDKGIWSIVNEYFRSYVVWIPFANFLPRPDVGEKPFPGGLIWPGGYLLGLALLTNLLAAHTVRFKVSWKRSGILLIHAALILLLVGEAVTREMAIETQMPIYEGQTIHWAHDIREVELAVVDHAAENHDNVVAVSQAMLEANEGKVIRDAALPFDVKVEQFMVNSTMGPRHPGAGAGDGGGIHSQATHGVGRHLRAAEVREVSGVGDQTVNYPTAIITLLDKPAGESQGTFMVSPHLFSGQVFLLLQRQPELAHRFTAGLSHDNQVDIVPQEVECGGSTYAIYLRFRRHYKPYTVQLLDFKHDLYTGTTTPRNFSSEIRLTDEARREDRNVLVYMNHPLRYEGETFFQSGWLGANIGTVLQLVRNPGWQIPYIACVAGALGMLIHFGILLFRFITTRAVT